MIAALFLLACGDPVVHERERTRTVAPDVDLDGDGHAALADGGWDCDDADPSVHPDAIEVCNGVDDDCDLAVDDADDDRDASTGVPWWTVDGDGDGYGVGEPSWTCEVPAGMVLAGDDCDDDNPLVNPGMQESCRPGDDDCDGLVDDEDPDVPESQFRPWFSDDDGDGWGDPDGEVVDACSPPEGFAILVGDCDDSDGTVFPDAEDACTNGVDEDCDGVEPHGMGLHITRGMDAAWIPVPEDLAAGGFTLEGWFFAPSADVHAPLFQLDEIEVGVTGTELRLQYYDGAVRERTAGIPSLADGTLHHIALTWNAVSRVDVLVDGRARLSVSVVERWITPEALYVGRRADVGLPGDILVTQVRLDRGRVSAAGARPEASLGLNAETWALWWFDNGAGSVVADRSGNANHLVVSSSTWAANDVCQ